MLTQERLKFLLTYYPGDGRFFWNISPANNIKPHSLAGSVQNTGYLAISIYGKKYLCHRLAFLYVNGKWPEYQVDHINGDRSDNSWKNLREATNSQNGINKPVRKDSSTQVKNVHKNGSGFIVRMVINGKDKCFGTYPDIELAMLVAEEARNKYQGEFKFKH